MRSLSSMDDTVANYQIDQEKDFKVLEESLAARLRGGIHLETSFKGHHSATLEEIADSKMVKFH